MLPRRGVPACLAFVLARFVTDFDAMDLNADMNCDGVVDFGDVAVFVQAFGAGC